MTFSGRFLLSLIGYASARGIVAQELVALTGCSEEELAKEDSRVESEVYNRVIEQAVERTGDLYFGLHAGEYLNLSATGLIGQITQTSRTVKEALDYCCEFASLGCRALPMALQEEGGCYRLSFVPDPLWLQQSPISVKQTIDGTLAFTVREFHALTRHKHYPVSAAFHFKRPGDASEYERVLNCALHFNQPETALFFAKQDIDQPVVTSNYTLLRVLVEHAYEKLAEVEQEEGFHATVKRSIMNLARPEFPTINQVAANMNLSIRTLQRKLGSEGYSYKALLEQLRKELAFAYLKKPDLSINEISWLLNYADSSVFIRSFKRWTGTTPKVWREKTLLTEEAQ